MKLTQQQLNHLQDMSGAWTQGELIVLQTALGNLEPVVGEKVIKKLASIIFNPGGHFAPFNPLPIQTRSEETGLNYYATLGEAFNAADKDKSIWKISFSLGDERVRLVKLQSSSSSQLNWVYESIGMAMMRFAKDTQDEDFVNKKK